MQRNQMRILLALLLFALCGYMVFRGFTLQKENSEYQILKSDYAELTKINYGVFNMKAWRERLLDVFNEELNRFNMSSSSYGQMEAELNVYLRNVYRDYIVNGKIFDQVFADAEKNEKINKMLLTMLRTNLIPQIKTLQIEQHIPAMAKTLAAEFQKSEPKIKEVMRDEIKTVLMVTDPYPQADPREKIYQKYGFENVEDAKKYLSSQISEVKTEHYSQIANFYAGLFFLIVLTIALQTILGFNLTVSIVSIISVIFLILGISFPMIDIDVRMNSFVFSLFNQTISFEEQSMFYQSKSILQVTRTLMEGRGIDLKIVGVLILLFSIVFPLIKLVLSSIYLYSNKLQENKVASGLIFYLGKWSMADVFVVAMFMAYIGFYGLVESQLGLIERNEGGFGIETVNYSTLAPGALFFATYCVLSILTGLFINRKVEVRRRRLEGRS